MATRFIIMAHGHGERLAAELQGMPKQLISMGIYTILGRTLHVLTSPMPENVDVTVVGPRSLLRETTGFGAKLHGLEKPGFCILDGLAQTQDLWSRDDRTLVLLGDVIWRIPSLLHVIANPEPIFFAGTPEITPSTGELYAFSWKAEHNQLVANGLADAPCRRGQYDVAQPGHLRNLLWWLQGYRPKTLTYHPVDDWTTDIDTPDDMKKLPLLRKLAGDDLKAWS